MFFYEGNIVIRFTCLNILDVKEVPKASGINHVNLSIYKVIGK